ncbi:MAG: prolipoprotein diacylglyceryl transferase, partial [Candidatus Sericytochromatia bacterium]
RTGDAYVLPLCVGIALGRIGCFLTGLDDHTYGLATTLPWGVDFGDGLLRHPTQLYEAAFMLLLAPLGARLARLRPGAGFQAFMAGYCAFRLGIEWLKPTLKIYAGLSAIQWACLLGLGVALYNLSGLLADPAATPGPEPELPERHFI